jgi:hypothetical protein
MATTYKVLGQCEPSANTLTALYTVPAATQAVVSTIVICNKGSAALFRIAVRIAGATVGSPDSDHTAPDASYVVYDTYINPRDTVTLTLGITLGATDVISVRATTADVSFSAFGAEITA